MEPVVVALVGVLGAAFGAAMSSWLGAREAVAQELRELRLWAYPPVWERTGVVSRWPQTDAGPENLSRLHEDLRHWYYEVGGLYLSEDARARFGELQELLAQVSGHRAEGDFTPTYTPVMESASAFRTALAEDLHSRQQRSLLSALHLGRRHRAQASAAARRLHDAPRAEGAGVHRILPTDEDLRRPQMRAPRPEVPGD